MWITMAPSPRQNSQTLLNLSRRSTKTAMASFPLKNSAPTDRRLARTIQVARAAPKARPLVKQKVALEELNKLL